MSRVFHLNPERQSPLLLSHPAGVELPFGKADQLKLLIPEVRNAIVSGAHCAGLIAPLSTVVRPGERVVVCGSGIGVLSTLIAKRPGVERVIAIEPNILLARFIEKVHRANGVPWIETLNGVAAESTPGRVPLFVRHDVRTSSFDPDDGPWRQIMLVPKLNLDLILAEERISLIVAKNASDLAPLVACSALGSVDRILFEADDVEGDGRQQESVVSALGSAGFDVARRRTAVMVERLA